LPFHYFNLFAAKSVENTAGTEHRGGNVVTSHTDTRQTETRKKETDRQQQKKKKKEEEKNISLLSSSSTQPSVLEP